jgi:hypothetical protein
MTAPNNCEYQLAIIMPKSVADIDDTFVNSIKKSIRNEPIIFILVHDDDSLDSENLFQYKIVNVDLNFIELSGKFENPGSARNAGMDYLKESLTISDWTVFWDSDDFADPKQVLEIIGKQESSTEILIGNFKYFDSKRGTTRARNYFEENVFELVVNPGIWRVIFRTKRIEKFRFPALSMAEDQVFLAAVGLATARYKVINDVVYRYTFNRLGQLTGSINKLSDLEPAVQETLRMYLDQKGDDKAFTGLLLSKQVITIFVNRGIKKAIYVLIEILIKMRPSDVFRLAMLFIKSLWIRRKLLRPRSIYQNTNFMSLTGGLGNQLFEYAFALAKSKGSKIALIESLASPRSTYGISDLYKFNLDESVEAFAKINANSFVRKVAGYSLTSGLRIRWHQKNSFITGVGAILSRVILSRYIEKFVSVKSAQGNGFFEENIDKTPNIFFGYFQSYKWASESDVQEKLKKLNIRQVGPELILLREVAAIEKPLVIHIRLGDYHLEPDFGIIGSEYYAKAIKLIEAEYGFGSIWVFSDQIELVRDRYNINSHVNIRWISEVDGSNAATLEAMRLGKAYVIGNSSFSWWGAFLSYEEGAPVIAPEPWFVGLEEPKDLTPPHWMRLGRD